jgi:hypothetical protein
VTIIAAAATAASEVQQDLDTADDDDATSGVGERGDTSLICRTASATCRPVLTD